MSYAPCAPDCAICAAEKRAQKNINYGLLYGMGDRAILDVLRRQNEDFRMRSFACIASADFKACEERIAQRLFASTFDPAPGKDRTVWTIGTHEFPVLESTWLPGGVAYAINTGFPISPTYRMVNLKYQKTWTPLFQGKTMATDCCIKTTAAPKGPYVLRFGTRGDFISGLSLCAGFRSRPNLRDALRFVTIPEALRFLNERGALCGGASLGNVELCRIIPGKPTKRWVISFWASSRGYTLNYNYRSGLFGWTNDPLKAEKFASPAAAYAQLNEAAKLNALVQADPEKFTVRAVEVAGEDTVEVVS